MRTFTSVLVFLCAGLVRVNSQTVDFRTSHGCFGQPTTLISEATVRDSIVLYLWDLNGDGSFYDAIGDSIVHLFQLPGYQNVGHKVVTIEGHSKAIYKQVPIGGVSAGLTFENACVEEPVLFHNTSVAFADTAILFIWDFGDGSPVSNLENPIHTYMSNNAFLVSFIVQTSGDCKDSIYKDVVIENPPVISFTFYGDTIFPIGDSLIVQASGSFDSVLWSTGARTITIVVRQSGTYTCTAYKGSCSGMKSFTAETREYGDEPEVEELFTPNGDGFNDHWEILNLVKMAPCETEVYNRRGERVFSSSDYNNDWDGTWKGKSLPNDTYYYFVRCYNKKLAKGTVNILK